MPPKKWLELSIQVPFEFVEPVTEMFRHNSKGNVAIEEAGGWNPDEGEGPTSTTAIVRTYIPQTPAFKMKREIIHIGISLIGKITSLPELQEREIEEKDWEAAWKAHFTPLLVGETLVVQPPWHPSSEAAERHVIEIDPGLAFGTGHHPTTFRTLEAMERLLKPGDDVLDVGAGSGILSVGAAKLGAGKVLGVEIDKVAVKAGRANLRSNGVSNKVRFFEGSLPHPRIPAHWADLVLANVNSVALCNLAPALHEALKPGGWLVAAGILEERLHTVEDAFTSAGLRIQEHIRDGEWVVLIVQ